MAWTVWNAFDQFRRSVVDIDPQVTIKARASRDYLFDQIKDISRNYSNFPKLLTGDSFITFGSFARRTKIRPLDDIDFLVILDGANTAAENNYYEQYKYKLKFVAPTIYFMSSVPSFTIEQFADNNGYINSTKVLNTIKLHLSDVNSYAKAEIRKTMQAVTLNLKSYEWVYDIVPAIKINGAYGRKGFFLIPDGYGNWIATDPRIDAYNITQVNLKHNGKFLPTIRLLKYWNYRTYKPCLSSYYFETLAIKVFENCPQKITDFPNAVKLFFDYCPHYLSIPCSDPKNLGANLDANIDNLVKQKVINAMTNASLNAREALIYESQSNYKQAIDCWQRVFGSNFPNYG